MKSRKTRQKATIEGEIATFQKIFSAEDLYKRVAQRDGKIGVATIYRSLKDLVLKGKLHSYTCDRKAVYSLTERVHCHFTCKICKKAGHLKLRNINFLENELKMGICHLQIDVTGICETCQKSTNFTNDLLSLG
ncbi:MAG: transcriptional repressor [archaeon]